MALDDLTCFMQTKSRDFVKNETFLQSITKLRLLALNGMVNHLIFGGAVISSFENLSVQFFGNFLSSFKSSNILNYN